MMNWIKKLMLLKLGIFLTKQVITSKILKKKHLVFLTQLLLLFLLQLIQNKSTLIKKADYDAKILDIEEKYFITSEYNKLTNNILDTTLIIINLQIIYLM